MARRLNFRGRIAGLIGRVGGLKVLQPLYERLYVFSLLGMNVGSATYGFDENGEIRVMEFVRDRFNEGPDEIMIFDVGAHRGDYAENLVRIFGEKAHIYCFEPSAAIFADLKGRVSANPNLNLHQLGLSDEEALITLYDDEQSIPTMVAEVFEVVGGQPVGTETVKTVRLDDFCQKHGVERINFLKLDIEGFELKVLRGAGKMLSQGKIDFIQFEFGHPNIGSRSFFHDFYKLLDPEYNTYRILRKGLHPLKSYHPKYEIFLSVTNYLSVRKSIDRQSADHRAL